MHQNSSGAIKRLILESTAYRIFSNVLCRIIQDYGREEGCLLPEMTGSQIARKLELCTSVLKVLDVITPGYSVSRGL